MDKKKRTWCYLQAPHVYEMSPCSCGNENTQWSEYEKHLWCEKCKIDFIPESAGVFSSPIPMEAAKLMGIFFDRVIIETNELESLDNHYKYIKVLDFRKDVFNKLYETVINSGEYIEDKRLRIPIFLDIKQEDIIIKYKQKDVEQIFLYKNRESFTIPIATYSDDGFKKFFLDLVLKDKELVIEKNKEYDGFLQFLLTQKLKMKLTEKEKEKKLKI